MARRKSKSNMKQIYLIRRTVALLIIVLILIAIFTKCSNKNNDNTTIENTNRTQISEDNNTEVSVINGVNDENHLNQTNDHTSDPATGEGIDSEDVFELNEKNLQEEYKEFANVEHRNGSFFISFKDDSKELVKNREEEEQKEAFKEFWESFKYKVTKSSETLAETVKPGIEFHVLDPAAADGRTTMLLIKDGSTIFDSVNN